MRAHQKDEKAKKGKKMKMKTSEYVLGHRFGNNLSIFIPVNPFHIRSPLEIHPFVPRQTSVQMDGVRPSPAPTVSQLLPI